MTKRARSIFKTIVPSLAGRQWPFAWGKDSFRPFADGRPDCVTLCGLSRPAVHADRSEPVQERQRRGTLLSFALVAQLSGFTIVSACWLRMLGNCPRANESG
jgi:hypothetical protein